ncbi:MAG: cytochrome c2/plastocyanin [Planctomycetota bacterium]|jgi:cytochrome c2/plastocyanin
MADRGDTHYHVPNMNRWFLFSSVFFAFTMLWTVIDDWNAEWKTYQRGFRALELDMAQAALNDLEDAGALETESDLVAKVEEARASLDQKQAELDDLESKAYAAKEAMLKRDVDYKKSSEDLKWKVFNLEQRMVDAETGTTVAELEADMGVDADRAENRVLAYEVEQLIAEQLSREQAIADLQASVAAVQKDLTVGTRDLIAVRERIEKLAPSAPDMAIANFLRDAPGIDFVEPNLKVNKYVLDGIEMELNFTKKPVIDMCTTCHMGMERAGFEDAEQPFRSHPRLDLFLKSNTPHAVKDMGCTVCHRGSGESLSFQHTDHRPSNAEEENDWHEEQHWHKQHHWDYPMLESSRTEASCIQCHKTSMELIAEDAPAVTEGYRLVERFGCYACHKIDWFPTKRRPGPSLLGMKTKLTPEWTESWISRPRDFRPSTWMPQIFHLENYAADEVVVKSQYEEGRNILGQEWNENAISAVTTFLYANHDDMDLPEIPTVGNSERGREVMNLVGCFACHNTAPWDGEDSQLGNRSDEIGRYNDKGPNLRGVTTKLNKEWLFHWLKNPSDYWPDTNMPNLDLTDQDAADITAYMMEDPDGVFGDTPEAWSVESKSMDLEVLQEQARWFFTKSGRAALERRFSGEDSENDWSTVAKLAPAVGEAMVKHYGCFSCHDIAGLEKMMPIGAELSEWGTKTVDKLDFGLSYLRELTLPASLAGERETLPKLNHHYREGWLSRKLDHPRSFDLDKVKNPKEKLRMPWFDLTDEQVGAITTFIVGLVADNVPDAKMEPNPEQRATDAGMRQVRQKNCVACHVIEPSSVTFQHSSGEIMTAVGEFLPFTDEPSPPRASNLDELLASKADWEDFMEEEMDEVAFQLWSDHADLNESGQNIQIPFDKIISVSPPEGGDFVAHVTDYYQFGVNVENPDYDPNDEDSYATNPWTYVYDDEEGVGKIEDVDGQFRAYGEEEYSKLRWTFAPPVLVNEGAKLQADWFYSFLLEPFKLRQQVRVRMPSFNYREGEAQSIADYFLAKARKDWEPSYAAKARLALGREAEGGKSNQAWDDTTKNTWPVTVHLTQAGGSMNVDDMSARMAADGTALSTAQIQNIEAGYAPEVSANFAKLQMWAEKAGFLMAGEPLFGFEQIERQTASYLAIHGGRIPFGEDIATNEAGINCFTCHPKPDGSFVQDPIAWAPPLENVRTRMRPDFVRDWLWSPTSVYPGTAMPANFAADEAAFQALYPNSSNNDQIEAVVDWLYNMEGGAPVTQLAQAAPNTALMTRAQLEGLLAKIDAAEAAAAAPPEPEEEETPADAEEPMEEAGGGQESAPDPEPAVVAAPVTGAGVISGRVVFDGTPPTIKPLIIKDEGAVGCCAPGVAVDDTNRTLEIGAGAGIKNVIVTLEVDGAQPQAEPGSLIMDQLKCRFEPRVSVVPVGSTFVYKNSDSISHNVHTYSTKNESVNVTVAAGSSLNKDLTSKETFKVGCDIHPWMSGYVFVTDATHWATTTSDGSFSIQGVPPGTYKLAFWHETLGKEKGTVTVPESGSGEPVEVKMKAGGGGGRRTRR